MSCNALPPHIQAHPTPDGRGDDHDNSVTGKWSDCWVAFGERALQGLSWVRLKIPFTAIGIPLYPLLAKWRKYPMILVGYNNTRFMQTTVREDGESSDSEVLVPENSGKFQFFQKFSDKGASPLQKYSLVGFQLTWPLHFVFWWQIRPQVEDQPGSEIILFFRIGARWDSGDDYFVYPAYAAGTKWS